jgi:hypothetical protein
VLACEDQRPREVLVLHRVPLLGERNWSLRSCIAQGDQPFRLSRGFGARGVF